MTASWCSIRSNTPRRTIPIPAQIDKTKMRTFTRQTMDNPSLNLGEDIVIRDASNPNHLTMDTQGRVWISAAVERNGPRRPFAARARTTSSRVPTR